jgi:tRNA dimethylallyltransferase
MSNRKKIIFLAGPTAIGKSKVAVYLARKIKAEIISCDSMQIYKGMDVITSKPPKTLRKRVLHHLIGVIPATQQYDVSRYRNDALKKVKEIFQRGRLALFVGGTGLYMSILIDGIFNLKSENKTIRNKLYIQAKKYGSQYLHERLSKVDPKASVKIHPNDTKRLVRALEVFETTGRPISELQKQRAGLGKDYNIKIFCLNMERDKLYKKIDDRVEQMFKQGLVKEAKRLLKLKLSKTARFAIGLRELKGYFDGNYDLEEAKRLIKRNSRQYAKRQLTWFRKDKRIKWVEVGNKEKPSEIAKRIWKELC